MEDFEIFDDDTIANHSESEPDEPDLDEIDEVNDEDNDEIEEEEEEDEADFDTDYEVLSDTILEDDIEERDELDLEVLQTQGCCKYLCDNNLTALGLSAETICGFAEQKFPNSLECLILEINQFTSASIACRDKFTPSEKTSLLDTFLRYRHEVLSSNLIGCLGLKSVPTDVAFCNVTCISSKRTPDFIEKLENGTIIVIEVSAVSDVDRGAKAKGDPRKGFEPKYEREIRELRAIGINVHYSVVLFDVKDEYNRDHIGSINELALLFNKDVDIGNLHKLEYIRKEFCNSTKMFNDCYGKHYKYLFSEPYTIKSPSNFESLYIYGQPENEFDEDYQRYPVSNYMYESTRRLIIRLPMLLEQMRRNKRLRGETFVANLDCRTDRFELVKDKSGATLDEWENSVDKNLRLWMCKNMRVVDNGVEIQQKADFEYFDLSGGGHQTFRKKMVSYRLSFDKHPSSTQFHGRTILKDYKSVIEAQEYANKMSKYEDKFYESKILSNMNDFNIKNPLDLDLNLKVRPFCDSVVGIDMFEKAVNLYNGEMHKKNFNGDNSGKIWVKSPFIYPIYSPSESQYVPLDFKPLALLREMKDWNLGPYTNLILCGCLKDDFQFGTHQIPNESKINECRKQLGDYTREVNARLKELTKNSGHKKSFHISDLEDFDQVKTRLQSLNQSVREESKQAGIINKKIGIYTFNNKKTSRELFLKEMKHFKSKSTPSFYKGIGMNYHKDLVNNQVGNLFNVLMSASPITSSWDILDEKVYADSRLLKDLKEKAIEENSGYYRFLKNTNIYSTCEFISKFCHSLLFHSQTSANSKLVAVDNLGYRDVLLIVKGGKKIFGTKRTKLFRLFYPTYTDCASLYEHLGHKGSFDVKLFNNKYFICTPWMNYHETIVTDGLTICHRLMGFALLNNLPNKDDEQNLLRVFFNIALALHNRRQTEMLMHNLRYVFMNCMSYFSSLDQILPELAGFNYDLFQVWLREKLSSNFVKFATEMKRIHDLSGKANSRILFSRSNLKHPFMNFEITETETLALSVYSTYLMSKAPTTQTLEQVSNLKSMCEIHHEFKSKFESTKDTVQTLGDNGLGNYYDRMFESDFNYDPKYCVLLGKFFGDYLSNITKEKNIFMKWEQILEESWNSFANTKGLRYKGKDFFGSKGYYVVNKCLLEEESGYQSMNKLLDLIESDLPDHDKAKKIKEFNQTYRKRIAERGLENVVFHVVDKKQRGGKREIFVMDLETKVHQQVIEKYMAYLCKLTPNEMISIPSNRRLQTIHSRVFEAGGVSDDQCYLVLDCRKWAPKSLVDKFLLFLSGMNKFLPSSFIYHCQNFFYLLMNKKIYTRKHIFENFKSNQSLRKYTDFFIEDESNGGFFYQPEYSWVMGIFNYFSSIFHVACQMHIAHLLRLNFSNQYNSECALHMVAHSDDSAGRMICSDLSLIRRGLFYYELFMHSANHLISKKKSNVGKMYYEFISILYIGGELLSLLAKFSGVFNFHPSDKGYCNDINDAYSKCLELLLNGSSMNQAYLAMKIQSDLIYKFYFTQKAPEISYELPPAMFGSVDAHPLMVMLCGSDSDTVRLFHVLEEEKIDLMVAINECLLPADSKGEGLFKQFSTNPNVRLNPKLAKVKEDYPLRESIKESWSLKNVRFNNTGLDIAQFLLKLDDKNFIAALQDESMVRRISRSYYFRSGISVNTKFGLMKMRDIREMIFLLKNSLQSKQDYFGDDMKDMLTEVKNEVDKAIAEPKQLMKNVFNLVFNEALLLQQHLDKFGLKKENIINASKTCKPVHFCVQSSLELCPVDFEPNSLVSWIKEPNLRFMLPEVKGLLTAENYLKMILSKFNLQLDDLSPETLFSLTQKVHKKSKVEFFCYSNLPSGIREISTYQDIMLFIAHNSNNREYIKGLDVQYGKTVSGSSWVMLSDFSDPNLQWTMAFYLVFLTMLKTTKIDLQYLLSVRVNPPKFLDKGGEKSNLLKIFAESRHFWSGRYKHERYLLPYMHQIERLIDNYDTLDPDILADTYYYTFLKRQFLVDNLWLGRGRLFISCGRLKLVINVNNVRISHVTVREMDHFFNNEEISYINFCLHNSQLPTLNSSMRNISIDDWDKLMLGVDQNNNLYIGKGRDMIVGIDAEYKLNLDTPLSQLDLGVLTFGKKGKVVWKRSSEESISKHILTFIPLSPQNSMELLKNFIVNDLYNQNIISKFNSNPNKFLLDMCVADLDIEVNVNVDQIISAHSSTATYKILKHCHQLQLCGVTIDKPNYSHYPAQDGGLLRALIEYSKSKDDFDFRWEHHLSPEYMTLKSTQPDAFTTELFDNIKENYDKLFSKTDKQMIMKALSSLITDRNFTEGQILRTASEWGFIGVQGALDNMLGSKKQENFKGIRSHPKGPLRAYYSKVFWEVNFCLYELLSESVRTQSKGFETNPVNWSHISSSNYKNHFISFVHQIMMGTYQMKPRRNKCVRVCEVLAYTILKHVLSDKDLCKIFEEKISKVANFRTMPCREVDIENWYLLWSTLLKNFEEEELRKNEVDYVSIVDRTSEYERPYTLTKSVCQKMGIRFDLKRTYHTGAISSTIYSRFTNDYKSEIEGSKVVIKLTPVRKLNAKRIPISCYMFPRHPFNNDFMNSDEFEDVIMELQSTEFDLDSYDDALGSCEEGGPYNITPVRRVKILERGRLVDCINVEFKVVFLFGGCYNYDNLSMLRQTNEHIILVSDHLDLQMNTMTNSPLIFRNIDDRWFNQSLLDPKGLFIYIFSVKFRQVDFWERTLGLKVISSDEINKLMNADLTCYRSGAGLKVGSAMITSGQDASDFYKTAEKLLDEREEVEAMKSELTKEESSVAAGSSEFEFENHDEMESVFKLELESSGMDVECIQRYMLLFKSELEKKKAEVEVEDKEYYTDLATYFKFVFGKGKKGEQDILKVKSAFSKILTKDLSSEQRELIFQVPLIFGGNRSNRKSYNNKVLRNPYFISEMEAISPGLIWDLLTGSLGISKLSRQRWENHLMLLDPRSESLTSNPKGKRFYLNLIKMILNDAKPAKENDKDDERWSNLIHRSTEIILKNETTKVNPRDIFEDPDDIGRLDYDISGFSNLLT